jgi:hypothetical protein
MFRGGVVAIAASVAEADNGHLLDLDESLDDDYPHALGWRSSTSDGSDVTGKGVT